jgi:hypothetical protein
LTVRTIVEIPGWMWLELWWADVKFGVRTIGRQVTTTVAIVISLALGVGST